MLVLRLALLLAWAGISASALVSSRVQGPGNVVMACAGALVFVVAMLANLRGAPHARTTTLALGLIALQVVSGILVATDFMFLVAIELPLVLPDRHAVTAFVVVVVLVMLVGFAEARFGTFYAAPELAGMSRSFQVWLTMAMTAGWLMLAFAGGLLAATEVRARQEVDRLMAELRVTNRMLEGSSREAERLHIARELHDTVGHRLAALGVNLDLESRRARDESAAVLREARDATQQLLAEVRDVVGAMRRDRDVDLKRGIATLVAGLGNLDVDLAITPGLHLEHPAASHALLRCAQEALTNALRHGRATKVRIELFQTDAEVRLTVRDDGAGAAEVREGHGLRGMRERLEALGGTLRIETVEGAGFGVIARVPIRGGAS